jgi:fibronectin-binding autotransporter adhesin
MITTTPCFLGKSVVVRVDSTHAPASANSSNQMQATHPPTPRKMKTTRSQIRLLITLLLATAGTAVHAADIVKTNNATALNAPGSWVGGVVPTAADLAIFDSTLDGSFSSYALGGNLNLNGISFRGAASAQSITATASSTLTLANGSPGIAITSAALNDFNIACLVNLGTSGGQIFNVLDPARTLTMSGVISGTGPLTKTGDGILKLSASHTYTGGTVISGGTLQLGSANTLAAGTITVQNGATLDLRGFGLVTKAYVIRIAGTGVGGGGALVDGAGAQLNLAFTNLVLDADASVGGTVRFDMRPTGGGFPFIDLAGNTLTKVGVNTFFLQELSAITDGDIFIQAGILGLNGVPLTGNGLVTVGNGAELRIFRSAAAISISTVTRPMTLESGALVSYTGVATADAIEQSVGSPITLTGDATINGSVAGAVFELAGPISGGFGLTKTGPGTLLLSGASTYSGATLVSAGSLALGTAWSGAGAVTVNDGASLEVRQAALNATLKLDSLTLGSAAGPATATFNLGGFANPSSAVVNVTNVLTLNGTTTVNLSGTSTLTSGTFKLFTFGSIAGSGDFQMGVAPGGSATLTTNGNSIEVTFVPVTLTWRGEVGGVDLGDWAPGVDTNWLNVAANSRASYVDGNGVIFNDTLTGTTSVNISAAVSPSSVVVNNATTNYTFSGGGKITGTTGLTKTGAGTLTLALVNDYTGATTIANGTVQLAVPDALPAGASSPELTLNGTLNLNANNQTLNGITGNGTIDNTTETLATLTFNGSSTGSTFSGLIQNSGGAASLKLAKTGTGIQTLTGNNTFSGGLNINNGLLQLGSDNALGSGLFSIAFVASVSADSTAARLITNSVGFAGTSTMTLGHAVNNGVLTFSGPVNFSGGTRTIVFNSDVVFSGSLDNGGLTKQGAGTMTMNGVGNNTGTTTIQAGTLAGTGSFAGLVTIAAGGSFAPGPGIGTMTITSNLFLGNVASTVNMEVNAADNTSDQVVGMFRVTYNGTLNVANLGGTFTNGQTFQLFSATETVGNFAATNLPALPGDLVWNWNPTAGTLSVVPPIATTPTNLTFTATGSTLDLTWPASHLGWIVQSNSISVADANSWYDIAGSTSATNLSITIDPALPQVFYRLSLP